MSFNALSAEEPLGIGILVYNTRYVTSNSILVSLDHLIRPVLKIYTALLLY